MTRHRPNIEARRARSLAVLEKIAQPEVKARVKRVLGERPNAERCESSLASRSEEPRECAKVPEYRLTVGRGKGSEFHLCKGCTLRLSGAANSDRLPYKIAHLD